LESAVLKTKFAGALLGTAVGDALGAFFEGRSRPEVQEIIEAAGKSPLLTYTDDTHMMIGVAESLVRSGDFDAEDMLRCFITNYYAEPFRGYASGPPYLFERVRQGADWREVSREIYRGGSYGNGAAMRIAPVGVFYHDDFSGLRKAAYGSSEITHAHPLGQEGAALEACAVALASGISPDRDFPRVDFISRLRDFCRMDVYQTKLDVIAGLSGEFDARTVARELGNGVAAFDSVPAAVYSFLSFPGSFRDAVLNAVSLGGDTDTIGAMTGAIAGAYLGSGNIPPEWTEKLENKTYIEALAERLWEIKYNRNGKWKKMS